MTGQCRACRYWQIPTREGAHVVARRWDEAQRRYVLVEEPQEVPETLARPGWRVCRRAGEAGARP